MSATNRGAKRLEQDSYPTPLKAVKQILSHIKTDVVESSLEPCRGSGVIYDHLPGSRRSWAELSRGVDYLKTSFLPVDLIVTNPPFSLALPFLQKSLTEASTVVYLLRLNFLGSQKRKIFWNEYPPSHLYVLSIRPSFTGRGTDATEYAWFCWDVLREKRNLIKDPPGIYVI